MPETTTIDLSRFLDSDPESRFGVPHVYQGHKYYTNTKICVRVLCDEPDCAHEREPNFKLISEYFIFDGLDTVTLPDLSGCQKCERCNGHGVTKEVDCSDCGGEGWIITFSDSGYEYENECKMCDHQGYIISDSGAEIECRACYGTRLTHDPIDVSGWPFSPAYLSMILSLNPTECFIKPTSTAAVVIFRFDGGDGVLMGKTNK